MVDRIAQALAVADGQSLDADLQRYRRLAIASLKPLAVPTEAMIDAAHEVVWFDAKWAIDSRRDFRRAVRAMITHTIAEAQAPDGGCPDPAVPR
jgi:hypothetical protein